LEPRIRLAQLRGRDLRIPPRRRLAGESCRVGDAPGLRLPSLSQIPRHFREPDDVTLLVVQRCDQNIRPEPRAVLPHPPSFPFEPPFRSGHVERAPTSVAILRRVELG